LEKCVKLLCRRADSNEYKFGENNYKYYCRNIINQWTVNYHYPSINFESGIDEIYKQYKRWNDGINGPGEPRDWNIFRNLDWTKAFSFMKSLQYHILISDVPEMDTTKHRFFNINETSDFLNLREYTHHYLNIIKGETDPGYASSSYDNRNGIGSPISRMLRVNNISAWLHTGPVCKNGAERFGARTNTFPGKFYEYIKNAIPKVGPLKIANGFLPIQCGISGSANAILSTLLWGTSKIVLSVPDLKKILLGIFALLSMDGGHTMQEVITAECLISNFYYYTLQMKPNITCVNHKTIKNLFTPLVI
jgi:hypothetical protein